MKSHCAFEEEGNNLLVEPHKYDHEDEEGHCDYKNLENIDHNHHCMSECLRPISLQLSISNIDVVDQAKKKRDETDKQTIHNQNDIFI